VTANVTPVRPMHNPIALVLIVLLAHAVATPSAKARSITMNDVIEMKGTNLQNLSFDGSTVLADIDAGPGRPDQIAGAREIVQWRDGQAHSLGEGQAPARSPDGRWLLFARDHAWVLKDERTGSARTFDAGRQISSFSGAPTWSPDSRFVAANYDLRGESEFRVDQPAKIAPGVRVVVHDQRDGSAPPPPLQENLRLLIWDVGKAKPLLREPAGEGAYAGSWRVTRDGHDYVYSVGQEAGFGLQSFTFIKALHVEDLTERDLYRLPNFNQSLSPQVSPDGRSVAFIADPDTPDYGTSGRVLLLDFGSGAVRNLAPTTPATILRWGADGRIYFLKNKRGLPQLCSVGLKADLVELTHDVAARRTLAVSPDGETFAYSATDGYGRSDLRIWSISHHDEKRLATLAMPDATLKLGRFEPTHWTTPDGVELDGFLVYPPGFDPKRRYPMLVDIHGGGRGQSLGFLGLFGLRANTPLDWHAWAALGYVVFVPDYRSAGEYGAAVNIKVARAAEDIDGSRQDADDVASGVRSMLQNPYIDSRRIAGMGHSAGGPRLASLLIRTPLFSAGIIDEPIPFGPDGLMLSMVKYGGPALWTRANLPIEKQEMLGADDLFDGWRVTTPTLITTGEQTHGAVDPLSAETLYAMLLSRGTPTRFVHYLDDGHIPLSNASYRDHFTEMASWLRRYAPPGPADSLASQPRTQSSMAAAR
jgi:dipeptidyl aminopeptidase/acylaminoacyl peptidase